MLSQAGAWCVVRLFSLFFFKFLHHAATFPASARMTNAERKRSLLLIDLLIVLYALAYQLQVPLEPYLVDTLVKDDGGSKGSTAAQYANLQSFFGLVQCIGSILVGYMIDRCGLRLMLLLNFAACAASYALLASATSMPWLYASKLPTLFMAGFLCAQTAVSTLTAPGAERMAQLGLLTTAYTLGATVGPSLGGYLGTQAAAQLAVAVSVAAGGIVLALPADALSTLPPSEPRASAAAPAPAASTSSWRSRAWLALSLAWPLLATKVTAGLVTSAMTTARNLALKNVFALSAAQLGLIMSTISLGTALASLGLGRLTALLGAEGGVVRGCLVGMTAVFACQAALFVSYAGAAAAPPAPIYVGLSLLLALCQYPLSTTLTALSTARVPLHARGTLMGLEHALFSLAFMAGPVVGVWVLAVGGMQLMAGAAAAVYAALLVAWSQGGGAAAPAVEPVEGTIGKEDGGAEKAVRRVARRGSSARKGH